MNILFTSFEYQIDANVNVPTADSYNKKNVFCQYIKNQVADAKYMKIIFNCQVNTNRNTAPI